MLEIVAILASEICFRSPQMTECQVWVSECMMTTQGPETVEELVEHCTQTVPREFFSLEGAR